MKFYESDKQQFVDTVHGLRTLAILPVYDTSAADPADWPIIGYQLGAIVNAPGTQPEHYRFGRVFKIFEEATATLAALPENCVISTRTHAYPGAISPDSL